MGRNAAGAVAGAIAVLVATASGCTRPEPRTHTVRIESMRFTPAEVVVHSGDTIEWVNDDLVPHTVAAKGTGLASGPIQPGSSWRWTVDATGRVGYVCTLHPTMAGQLEVR